MGRHIATGETTESLIFEQPTILNYGIIEQLTILNYGVGAAGCDDSTVARGDESTDDGTAQATDHGMGQHIATGETTESLIF